MSGRSRLPSAALESTHEGGVYVVLLFQSLIASGTHIIAKVAVEDIDALTLTFVRSAISSVALFLILLLRRSALMIRREDYSLIFWLSFLAIPLNQFLFLYGMRYTIPSNAALLYATTPVVVLVLSRLFLGEGLTRQRIIGVILGFIGVTIVIFERGISASVSYLFGNIVIFIAVLAWALYTVYGRKLIARYGAVESSCLTLILGTVLFLPFGIYSSVRFPYATLTVSNWLEIGYLSIITSVFSYLLWYYALSRIDASRVALFSNLQPLLTTALAVLILGQNVTAAFVIGGTIAIAGVVLAQFG